MPNAQGPISGPISGPIFRNDAVYASLLSALAGIILAFFTQASVEQLFAGTTAATAVANTFLALLSHRQVSQIPTPDPTSPAIDTPPPLPPQIATP